MTERTALTQKVQVGVESVPGTPVAATRRFQTLSIEPSPNVVVDTFRPSGTKYKALTALNKEWVTASIAGKGSYTEIVYMLSSVVGAAVITTPGGGITSRLWTYTPLNDNEDAVKSFTVEHGNSTNRADSFSHGIVGEFGMTFNRNSIDVTGAMMGQALVDDVVMTASGSVTTVPLTPILATQVSFYLDTTAAGLGATKLTRAVSAEFKISNRRGPLWVVDAANDSYVTTLETEPSVELVVTMAADDQGMALLQTLRDNDRCFFRIDCVGEIIEGVLPHNLQIDVACELTSTSGFSDQEGLYAIQWTFTAVHDAAWDKPYQVKAQNTLTAL